MEQHIIEVPSKTKNTLLKHVQNNFMLIK